MCGIAGFIGNRNLKQKKISKILSLMKRRGPDSFGYKDLSFFNKNLKVLVLKLKRS